MLKERFFQGLFALSAGFSIFAVGAIALFLFFNAFATISQIGFLEFIFGMDWYPDEEIFGIFPMIVGSIYVTALAIVLGVPIGVLSAVYLAYFCPKWLKKIIMPAVELLGAIPSVVYGFFGLVIVVPLVSNIFDGVSGKSILAASLILAIMVLPTIILVSKAAIEALPKSYYEGALALGTSPERAVFFAIVPAAKSGILASVILGVGRAIGEAMAVIMVAGNQVQIPHSLSDGVRTLTTNIVLEMGYAADLHKDVLIANAVVLFVFILIINISFSTLKGGKK
ncbi:phosphate ABC transporter permease subunit PstC [Campylobacter devanensis]|uniref:phosphate ABC transporter permease subunit PstC n=1 Tax=Campylobacter devanensis TaxID=3161138 RepID=UPI000A32EFF5|nr:phosphate ABC transporter permease subunit PstC [Campylobacter sp. P160]